MLNYILTNKLSIRINQIMKSNFKHILFLSSAILFLIYCSSKQSSESYSDNKESLQHFFKYTGDGSILMSGHRGYWLHTDYPDNSLEGLQNATDLIPDVFFEVDPRLTKDSVIILMHDATLERTTNGTGKVSDYTMDELKLLKLKDHQGNITEFGIPTLKEAIKWSIGKTTLNLDKKDVPLNMIVDLIKECEAEHHIMLTVHTGAQARYYYDRLPHTMLSAWIRNEKEFEDIVISGVPWHNFIAYVGQTINETNRSLVEKLHNHGVRCMISLSPTHDRVESAEERARLYKEEISNKPDIIESDLPYEVWKALKTMGDK